MPSAISKDIRKLLAFGSGVGVEVYGPDLEVVVGMVKEITATLQPDVVQQTVKVRAQASSISTEQIDLSSAPDSSLTVCAFDLK